LGTKGTIQSGAYQAALYKLAPQAFVLPIACPLFVPLVEEKWLNHPATQLIIQEYLRPIQEQNIDTVLLGCTHYPLLISLIQRELGKEVTIVDSASTCARQTAQLLQQRQLLSPIHQGKHQYYVSDDPEKFRSLAEHLFGYPPVTVELLFPEHLHSG
jgi:glutamate racemase